MTDYFYDMDLVVDPLNTSNVVANGLVSIYDPADTAGVTLLALKDPTGNPLPNPVRSNANGFLPPRIASLPQTMWKSGTFTGYFNSYKGLRDESVAAKTAAQSAADNAVAAASQVVTTAAVDGTGALVLTKASGATVNAGNVKGATGATGPKGDKGADGANVLPTDDAIKQAINDTASGTRGALNATYPPSDMASVAAYGVARWNATLGKQKFFKLPFVDAAADFGVVANDATTATANVTNLQAAITYIAGQGGGTVKLPAGRIYVNNKITIPEERHIQLEGSGMSHPGGTQWGTVLYRDATSTSEVLYSVGSGLNTGQRALVSIANLGVHGGGRAYPLARFARASELLIDNVRLSNSGREALVLTNVFNAFISNTFIHTSGDNATNTPAVRMDAPTGEDGCNGTFWSNVQWEGNTGPGLRVTADTNWSIVNHFSNCKWEDALASTWPLVHLQKAAATVFNGCWFMKGRLQTNERATGPLVKIEGPAPTVTTERRANIISSSSLSYWGDTTSLIEHSAGALVVTGNSFTGTPSAGYIDIASTVGAGDAIIGTNYAENLAIIVKDRRTGGDTAAAAVRQTLGLDVHVRNYGATDTTGATDVSAGIQAAINAAGAAGGGRVIFDRGTYLVNTALTLPVNKLIVLQGAGKGASGNIFGTRLTRSGTNAIFNFAGTGMGANQRVLPEIRGMEISGAGLAGDLVIISRASHMEIDNVRIANTLGIGAHLSQIWDSALHRVITERCGTGITSPAMLIDAVTGDGANGGTATVQLSSCIWQSNTGTDVRLTGSVADLSPCNDVEFTNSKFEGNGFGTTGTPDTYPYIDLEYAQDCQFANTRVSMPAGRACLAVIQQAGTSAGPRANLFANTVLDVAGTNPPTRYVDAGVGAMGFVNIICPSNQPTAEYIRIQGSAGRFRISGFQHNSPSPYSGFITDLRTVSEEVNKGRIAITSLTADGATAANVGDNAAWSFPAGSDTYVRAQVVIPRDVDTSGKCYIRAHWASPNTGNTRLAWVQRAMSAGTDITSAGTSSEITAAATTANQLVVTSWTNSSGAMSVQPGQVVTVKFGRKGTNAADTIAGAVQLVGLELYYDKRV